MENLILKNSSTECQNESVNVNIDEKGLFNSNTVFPVKEIPSENQESSENFIKNEPNEEINGFINCMTPTDHESLQLSELAKQKTYSPTLIESAIKVMKNLFSPEKVKSKSSNVSPSSNPISGSGSPCNSTITSGKAELLPLESENETQLTPGENSSKTHPQSNESDTLQIPLTLDPLNNTDESFMTTVSLIDDSFHSAVTNLDENGDFIRNGVCIKDNILNDSISSDLVDPSNDTLENNDSCLENTTLRMDNSSDGNKPGCYSVQNNDELKSFSRTQTDVENSEKVLVVHDNFSSEIDSKSEISKETPQTIGVRENGVPFTSGSVEMADLYLNNSFTEPIPTEGKIFPVGFETVEIDNPESANRENDCVDNTISTTTIVLNTGESVELDSMLMSLKGDDSDTNISSIAFEGECSMDNEIFETGNVPTNNIMVTQQKRSCFSEGNSPNRSESPKTKLNKSDELLSRRVLNEPYEKNFNNDKSSVDFSLMKFSEAAILAKKSNDKNQQKFKQPSPYEDEKIEPENKTNGVTVISQQSYTILNVHNKSLNRPVIEPLNVSEDLSEQRSFQKNDSVHVEKCVVNNSTNGSFGNDEVKSPQVKQSTPLWEGSIETGAKFSRPATLKLHSPDLPSSGKKINLSSKAKQIFSNNESIDGVSPVNPDDTNTVFRDSVEDENHVIKKRNEINRSPVQSQLKKLNDTSGIVQKLNQTPDRKSKCHEQSPGVHQLNQTFEKKPKTPGSSGKKRFIQTPKQERMNVTYDINGRSSPNSNKTFTKSPEIDEPNLTFNKSKSPDPFLNKTYDKPISNQLNQTFSKKRGSPVPETLNETYDKKTEPSVLGEIIQVSDGISNQTFILENTSSEEGMQQSNQTTENAKECDAVGPLSEILSGGNEKKVDVPPATTLNYRTNVCESNIDANDSFVSTKSSNTSLFCSDISTVVFNEEDDPKNRSMDDLSGKLGKLDLNENPKPNPEVCFGPGVSPPEGISTLEEIPEELNLQAEENLLNCLKDDKLKCDPDLVQLIREQFSSNDIEKICSVVQDFSSEKLTNDILKASEQFEKSFLGIPAEPINKEKTIAALSPQSFDFLNSIGGKPTGRDLSRESLYVKFDPLVQPSANSLIDFTKEGEALATTDTSPVNAQSTSICEQLLTISPQKKPDAIVPPLTPLSHKRKSDSNEEKLERLKELQNEIYFLKNLYAERERTNKVKMEEYENQIAKLTGESCILEDKLKESNEREKSLVKKMKEQTQSIAQLKVIMEEYVKVISKLSSELETIKNENLRQLETLSLEKDSYMTHLQNTEAAFTDVHAKYEKSKKTIVNLKANETLYRNTIAEQTQKMEEFKSRAKEAQEKALVGFQKIQEELNQSKMSHSQEVARLKAQLRKTELKVEALQESLDQKIKENQQLTAICDELIEGKK